MIKTGNLFNYLRFAIDSWGRKRYIKSTAMPNGKVTHYDGEIKMRTIFVGAIGFKIPELEKYYPNNSNQMPFYCD